MKLLTFLTGILCSLLVLSCSGQNKTSLNADEFEKAITTLPDVQVLDVRTPSEYFSGHIQNALQADWNDDKEFERRLSFIDKNKPVYVYCLAGGRSAAAADKMRKAGFKNVYELKGGTNAWRAANKPLIGKSTEKQMTIQELNATIAGSSTVLVDFGAEWCPPCKTMEPVLKNLAANNPNKYTLIKVDGGRDQDILKEYKVTALPVFIIFKNGKQVWRKDGIADEKELADHL
ncbi:MAG TPA: rhodanese-like domain-containing protein [Ferruginibacter sp.]|nr:rhodanese-like domain-containing protein [Ferruginibacter sp.]